VAEAPRDVPEQHVAAPIYDPESKQIVVRTWPKDTPFLDTSDSRLITVGNDTFLTSISHFRRARSKDGFKFEVEAGPAFAAADALEAFGRRGSRITRIADTYWVNYTAVSSAGISTALASSRDLHSFERHGVIFSPPNRDVTIFPEQIRGRYWRCIARCRRTSGVRRSGWLRRRICWPGAGTAWWLQRAPGMVDDLKIAVVPCRSACKCAVAPPGWRFITV